MAALSVSLLTACGTTPTVIDHDTVDARANADLTKLFADIPAPGSVMSLSEAIARAVKYNLDNRLAMIQSVVAQRHLDLTDYDKLPRLAARAGYTDRSKVHASSSLNLNTGVPNFGASTSQDREIVTADLELSWNTLDFGIAWIDARQAGNEVMIAVEQQRRITANIVRDVRDAYWRMVSAERQAQPLKQLRRDIQEGLNDSYAMQRAKLKPLEECLEDQRALLDLQRQVLTLQRGIEEARTELGGLIGLAPGSWFSVDTTTELIAPYDGDASFNRVRLQELALRNRPELLEEDYKSRIATDEIKKARLRWIPGLELFTGAHYNDNSYLLHNDWAASGVRLTWNLLNVLSAPAATRLAKSEQELGDIRRLALSMAVLTQVDVALQRLAQSKEDYRLASELSRVDRSTLEHYERQANASRIDRQTLLETRARDLVSRLRHTVSYAEYQSAAARLYASIGYEPMTLLDHDLELDELVGQVKAYLDMSDFANRSGYYVPEEADRRRQRADGYRGELGAGDALSTPGTR